MRQSHSFRPVATVCAALLLVAGCAGEGTAPETVASLVVTPASATVASRAPLPLTAAPRTSSGKTLSGRPVTWSSSDPAIASVSGAGLVMAGAVLGGAPALVTVSATSEGIVGHADLTVLPVPVATVAASPTTTTVPVGGSQQMTSGFLDATGVVLSGRTVSWSSSDTAVASVSPSGLVTAAAYAGGAMRSATITASSEGRIGMA
ncbi:MAG: Ig-like domain-containing protein, partial [Gemmatimonadaceae bacterium]|nr:Ig-like domain-containing protein [Gemmatimonadaceae bacterium]